jgi:hypothetical protein
MVKMSYEKNKNMSGSAVELFCAILQIVIIVIVIVSVIILAGGMIG